MVFCISAKYECDKENAHGSDTDIMSDKQEVRRYSESSDDGTSQTHPIPKDNFRPPRGVVKYVDSHPRISRLCETRSNRKIL